jgi:PAS domain S-box-containing protein
MESELSRLVDALPGLVWTTTSDGKTDFINRRWRDYAGTTLEAARQHGWTATIHPDDLAKVGSCWKAAVAAGTACALEARLRRFDGAYRWFSIKCNPVRDVSGRLDGWCGINTEIEEQRRAEGQLAAEKRLLELVALGVTLPSILEELCFQVEGLGPESFCSILFVDPDGKHFQVGAGPNLPAGYNAALEGLTIDRNFGPCSLAVETRSTIVVVDPTLDPRWGPVWPSLMAEHGLASCWSAPIFGSQHEVLGIFAIYRREPQGPTVDEQELIDRFAKIAGIAIERAQSDTAMKARAVELRRAHDHLAQAQKLSQTGSFTTDFATDTHIWSDELYRILEFEPGTTVSFKTFRSLIHPDDQPLFSAGFQPAVKDGERL